MITRRLVLAGAAACLCTAGLPSLANAQAAKPDPGQFVKGLSDRAISELAGKDLSATERNRRFRALLKETFDTDTISRFVLGRFWRVATDVEKAEYTRLFEDLIVQIYASRFAEYSGESYKINQVRSNGGETVVFGEIKRPADPSVRVDWRVRDDSGSLKIVDVVVEGVSMLVTQRDEFAAVIQRNGGKVSGLLDSMREKTAALKAEVDATGNNARPAMMAPVGGPPEGRNE